MTHFNIEKKLAAKNENAKFSIIIPTWNNLPFLKVLVESIRKNSSFAHQLILHINDGTDGTLEWAISQPDICFTRSIDNIGICKAMNLAAAQAYTEYILYINDDMYVCPQWDQFLWDDIASIGHKFFFISATMIEYFDTQNPCVVVANYGNTIESFNEAKLLAEYSQLHKNDWSGSTWPPNIVHKDLWDMVGGYSVEYSPGMYSDPDFSRKLWYLGVRYFKGVGKSKVYHFGSKSVGRIKQNKGRDTFLNKWNFSSGFFGKNFLRIGQKFEGYLPEFELTKMQKLNNFLKKFK